MIYVEILRAYRALRVYAIVMCAIATLSVLFSLLHVVVWAEGEISASGAWIAIFGCYASVAIAIALGSTLGREAATLAIAWTRPVPRVRTALAYVAVDVAAIVVAAALAIAALLLSLAVDGAHGAPSRYSGTGVSLLAGVGMAFMWYGILQAVTARLRAGQGTVRGLSAPLFFCAAALFAAPLPAPVHAGIAMLNVLDPIAWYAGTTDGHLWLAFGMGASARDGVHFHRFFEAVPEPLAVVVPWLIGALAIALATWLWTRREA